MWCIIFGFQPLLLCPNQHEIYLLFFLAQVVFSCKIAGFYVHLNCDYYVNEGERGDAEVPIKSEG
jgi:hypothetical protein